MFAFTLLALAGAAFAAPARRTNYGGCDLSAVTLNPPEGYDFPAPSGAPKFVTVGGGTQNYTCGADGKYASTGAVAQLFDISCIVFTDTFSEVQDLLIAAIHEASLSSRTYDEAETLPFLADHYFVHNPVTGDSISPKFDFTATVGDFVVGKVEVSSPAPTGPQDVNWLKLSNIEGSLSQEVYRTDTREGQPPASCKYGSDGDIEVPYAAKYWFF
ncbi:hypothetical protein CPB85DRAFT_1429936 [Mucidula mucida]|nr:hypothetical protein CPB85DRAFT_1429936 [Mucidula mucida]